MGHAPTVYRPPGMPVERLTVDTNVARDYLEVHRREHETAVVLFNLASAGHVEIALAPQAFRLDHAERFHRQFRPGQIVELRQLPYVSEATFPSDDLFPSGDTTFADAWDDLLLTWRSHEGPKPEIEDRFHVEAHVAEGRDVFLTRDAGCS